MPSPTQAAVIRNNASEGTRGNLSFPHDYEATSGNWLTLMEYEYTRPSSSSSFKPKQTGSSISLPLPHQLGTGYKLNWSETNIGAWGNAVQEALPQITQIARQVMENMGSMQFSKTDMSADGIKNKVAQIVDGVGGGSTDMLKNLLVGAVSDGVSELPGAGTASIYAGLARNPFVALLFEGPSLRTFNFNWQLFPKTFEESQTIENIIKTLKYGAHPAYQDAAGYQNLLFRYPNMYLPAITHNEFLFDFGFCVITDIGVDYHAMGAPIYFTHDGKKVPACINLSFTLQEMEIITKETISPTMATADGIPRLSSSIQGTNAQGQDITIRTITRGK